MDRRPNSTKQYTVNLQFLWRHWPLLKDCDMKIHKCVISFQCCVQIHSISCHLLCCRQSKTVHRQLVSVWASMPHLFLLARYLSKTVRCESISWNLFRNTSSSCSWICSRRLDQRSCESHAKCVQQRLKWNDDGLSSFKLKTRRCTGGGKTVCSASVEFLVASLSSDSRKFKCM